MNSPKVLYLLVPLLLALLSVCILHMRRTGLAERLWRALSDVLRRVGR